MRFDKNFYMIMCIILLGALLVQTKILISVEIDKEKYKSSMSKSVKKLTRYALNRELEVINLKEKNRELEEELKRK